MREQDFSGMRLALDVNPKPVSLKSRPAAVPWEGPSCLLLYTGEECEARICTATTHSPTDMPAWRAAAIVDDILLWQMRGGTRAFDEFAQSSVSKWTASIACSESRRSRAV